MSKFQALIATIVAGLGVALSGAAAAQTSAGPYVGGNINLYSKYSLNCDAGVTCDKTAKLGGKVYGGYDFGQYGVEAFAFSVGGAQGSLKNGATSVAGKVREDGVGVYGVLPITNGDFTFKGKLGLAYTRGRASYAAGGSNSDKIFTSAIGAGVGYALTKTLSLNADWDQVGARYTEDSPRVRVNMFSVGLSHKF